MVGITAIASQKGGVGKTTTAINLGAGLAICERRTLVLDVDPQANATSGFGIPVPPGIGAADVLLGRCPAQHGIRRDVLANLDVIPSGGPMRQLERHLATAPASPDTLQSLRDQYRHILIDCPPSLGAITTWAICAADQILIPVQCEYYAMEGLAQVMALLERLREQRFRTDSRARILLTMYDPQVQLAREVATEVRRYFGDKVFDAVIPRDTALSEAPGHGRTIFDYDIRSRGAWAYLQLTKEVIRSG